jgi:hypothetical protein
MTSIMIALTWIVVFAVPITQAFTTTDSPYPRWSTWNKRSNNGPSSSYSLLYTSRGPLPSLLEDETPQVSSSNTKSLTRRLYLSSLVRTTTAATAASAAAATFLPLPRAALAEVARGDSLPQGAEQFQRLLVLKSDVAAVIRRLSKAKVSSSSSSAAAAEQMTSSENDDALAKIDDKEWDALSEFMRKVYKGGDDMKSYTKGGGAGGSMLGSDKEKKEKAEEYAKLLQKIAQAGDGPISKKDVEGLMGLLKKADVVLQDFFELLRDVPDEI